jgi:hypothetical protein
MFAIASSAVFRQSVMFLGDPSDFFEARDWDVTQSLE